MLPLFTERFVFYQFPNSHILQYVIPGEHESWCLENAASTGSGMSIIRDRIARILTDQRMRRDYSVPPGMLAPAVEQEMIICRVLAPVPEVAATRAVFRQF